ncbi:ribose-5-phosphate isomerase RpiA [Terrihabitans sp. B22-R8]|uniref:ribose-5-phosphate isomerase RpiA n=1 Tax=Terrihabitans sp. B22-R8 TaxID=3425128 RepID=UPI00403C7587
MMTDSKRAAAAAALELVKPGMRLGLGTGSTAAHFVDLLGARVKAGLSIVGIPTSEATRRQAEDLGIPLTDLDTTPELDLTVDGADELDPQLVLIKGGGAALLREKIVANASARMVVIADASKKVDVLGAFPLPIEVVRFGVEATRLAIDVAIGDAGCRGELVLRRADGGHPLVTDEGHFIIDARLGRITDAEVLASNLNSVPGIVEHGLFVRLASEAFVAGPNGVEHIVRPAH